MFFRSSKKLIKTNEKSTCLLLVPTWSFIFPFKTNEKSTFCLLVPTWSHLVPTCSHLVPLGPHLVPIGPHLVPHLVPFGPQLVPTWSPLGPIWSHLLSLGPHLVRFGFQHGLPVFLSKPVKDQNFCSWHSPSGYKNNEKSTFFHLGASWGSLGAVLRACWGVLGRLGDILGCLWMFQGRHGGV